MFKRCLGYNCNYGTAKLHHWQNHNGCSFVMEPELKDSVASRPDVGWVGLCVHQGRCRFTRLNEGGAPGMWSSVLRVDLCEHALRELCLPLKRGRSSPGGWQCSRPQGASGLYRWAANSKKIQNQNTEVSQDCSSNNNHGIRPVEQSKSFWTDALKLQPRKKWTCPELPKSRNVE